MLLTHKLIVHGLITINRKYLLLKRTALDGSTPNVYPGFFDIPGGTVENFELPQNALIREVKEETNLNVSIKNILYEDSNFDTEKNIVFTTLVYSCTLNSPWQDFKLNLNEHDDFLFTNDFSNLKLVPYLLEMEKKNLFT